jgi:hypothetical protein
MTVTKPIFTKFTLSGQLILKRSYTELDKKTTNDSVGHKHKQTARQAEAVCI